MLITHALLQLLGKLLLVINAALQSQLVAQAKASVKPGLNFFQQKFSVQFRTVVVLLRQHDFAVLFKFKL